MGEEVPRRAARPAAEPARLWFFRIWTTIGAAVALVGLWWLLREPVSIVAAPLALAAVIVYLINPVVGWVADRGLPRPLAAALAYVGFLALAVAIGALLGPPLVRQSGEFLDRLPELSASVQTWANSVLASLGVDARIAADLTSEQTRDAVAGYLQQGGSLAGLLQGAGTVVSVVLHGLLVVVLAPILAFYVLADLPRLSEGVKRLFPPESRSEVVDVAERIGRTVGAYFRGQLAVATFVGIATALGLLAIGLPFWALVGLLTGLFNLVPLIGPFVGGVIGVTVALTAGSGIGQAIAVVVVMTLVQQVDNHVITPNVVSRTVKVHPVTVIVGLVVAGSLYGILGMFVAIPLIAAAKLVILYVLVTRVPSMRHLAGEDLFDGRPAGDATTLTGLGGELRRAWERRRGTEAAPAAMTVPDPGTDDAG